MGSQAPSSANQNGPASAEVGVRLNCPFCTLTWTKPCELERHLSTHTNASFIALPPAAPSPSTRRPHYRRIAIHTLDYAPIHVARAARASLAIHLHELATKRRYICQRSAFVAPHKRKEAFRKHYSGVHKVEPTPEIFEAAKTLCREMWEQEEAENGRAPVAVQSKKRPASAITTEDVAPPARKRRGAIASASTARPRPQPSLNNTPTQFFTPQLGHKRNESEESGESFVSSAYSHGAHDRYTETFNPAYPLPLPYSSGSSEVVRYAARDSSSPGSSPGGYQTMHMPSPQYEHEHDDVTEMALRRLAGAHIPTVQAVVAPAETVTGPSGGHYGYSSGAPAPDMSRSHYTSPLDNHLNTHAGLPWTHVAPSNSPNASSWSGTHDPAESIPRSMLRPVHPHSLGHAQLQAGQDMPMYHPYGDQNGVHRAAHGQSGHLSVASGFRGESHIGFIDNSYRRDDDQNESVTPPHPESAYDSPSFYDGPTPVTPVILTGVNGVIRD